MPGDNTGEISHFYSPLATSSFRNCKRKRLHQSGNILNEIPNYAKTGLINKIRNFIITLGGFAKVSKIQWKCLADGLLDFQCDLYYLYLLNLPSMMLIMTDVIKH